MTDARPSTTLFFSQLMLDYLSTAESLAAGVPDAETMPKIVMDNGMLQTVPGLVVTAQEVGGSHVKRVLHIVFATLFRNRAAGSDAPTDAASLASSTLFIDAARMHDLIASRLADKTAFAAYLATRDLHQLHGVRVMHYHRRPDPVLKRESQPTPRHELMCAVEIQAIWQPQHLAV